MTSVLRQSVLTFYRLSTISINCQMRLSAHSKPPLFRCYNHTLLAPDPSAHNYVFVWRAWQSSCPLGKMLLEQWDQPLEVVSMAETVYSTSCESYQKRSLKAAESTFQYVRPLSTFHVRLDTNTTPTMASDHTLIHPCEI